MVKMKKNLVSVLKKLVLSFGGEAKSNNAVDLVDEFADVATQGSSVQPVIVTITMTNGTNGTWSGATWDELMNAYMHNIAGFRLDGDMGWFTLPNEYNGNPSLEAVVLHARITINCVSDGSVYLSQIS